MKRVVTAAVDKARVGKVITKMKELLDAIEDLSEDNFREFDLETLYDELIEDIPAVSLWYKQL